MKYFGLFLLMISVAATAQTLQVDQNPLIGRNDTLIYLLKNSAAPGRNPCIPHIDSIRNFLTRMPFVISRNSVKDDGLIWERGFRNLIKQTFGKLILGAENTSKIGRYGTLDLSGKPAFDFSPLTIESNTSNGVYQDIFALNFSGKLNNDGILKLKDWRDLSVGISYVKIINNWTSFKSIDRVDTLRCIYKRRTEKKIVELCEGYKEKFEAACDSSCPRVQTAKEKHKLVKGFVDDFIELEIEAAEDLWKSKNFWWWNVTAKATRDQVKYIYAPELADGDFEPQKKTVFAPSATIALNYFTQKNNSTGSFLFSVWAGAQRKHALSDVFEPNDFQPFHAINDSVYQTKNLESVFVTDFVDLKKRMEFDFGFRCVGMLDISSAQRKKAVGLSLTFSRLGLVGEESFSSLFRTEAGLVIPFLKEDGTSTFNLELFYRIDNFSNFLADNDRFLGVRFNVPISGR